MAENDIYNNKSKYENFIKNLNELIEIPGKDNKIRKYYCKNKVNLNYYKIFFKKFEARDLSYVRRCRLVNSMRLITFATDKDLSKCNRDDIDNIVSFMHSVYLAKKSKENFITDIKYMWKLLFPEKDEKGRIDDTLVPYPVRHISNKIQKSKERLKLDRFSFEEFENIINYFGNDSKMQCYLTLSIESLARPQELCYLKLKNIELSDNYAKIYLTEHTKTGVGFLQCIESFPYLTKWLNAHPFKSDLNSYLFVKYDKHNPKEQLNPKLINERIRIALKILGINKPITCYSLKRNGVTIRRLRGESDVEIQHVARWNSTKQIKTYDMSHQEDSFKLALIRKGLITPSEKEKQQLNGLTRLCLFCKTVNGFNDDFCVNCKRPLDRKKIELLEQQENKNMEQIKEVLQILLKNADEKLSQEEKMKIKQIFD